MGHGKRGYFQEFRIGEGLVHGKAETTKDESEGARAMAAGNHSTVFKDSSEPYCTSSCKKLLSGQQLTMGKEHG
jgi:hypothetical protein